MLIPQANIAKSAQSNAHAISSSSSKNNENIDVVCIDDAQKESVKMEESEGSGVGVV